MCAIKHGEVNDKKHQQKLLTPRETEVLQLLTRGLSNSEISERLHVGPGTTKKHLAAISRKLGATNRTEAVARAVSMGLVNME